MKSKILSVDILFSSRRHAESVAFPSSHTVSKLEMSGIKLANLKGYSRQEVTNTRILRYHSPLLHIDSPYHDMERIREMAGNDRVAASGVFQQLATVEAD